MNRHQSDDDQHGYVALGTRIAIIFGIALGVLVGVFVGTHFWGGA